MKAQGLGQAWLREHKPPLLVVWGRNDPRSSLPVRRRSSAILPDADIHLLDAGHFALDEKNDEDRESHSPRSSPKHSV